MAMIEPQAINGLQAINGPQLANAGITWPTKAL